MKGRTLVRVGVSWLAVIVILACVPLILLPFLANEFVGLGIELPFPVSWFGMNVGFAIFRFLGYSMLLGWIPFLLIGVTRLVLERAAAKPKVGIEIR